MATKSMKEFRELGQSDLKLKAHEIQAHLFETKMKQVTGQLADTASIWRLRKDLARVRTLESQLRKGAK